MPEKSLPAANLGEFMQFLQCQLRKEAEVHMQMTAEFKDAAATAMWPEYEAFVKPNLGGTERWVPYHTILGIHEKFLVEAVHHGAHGWDERSRFLAIFVFRAHCKAELFTTAQLPILMKQSFWKDPKQAFSVGGVMEKAMLDYRHKTRKPLLTLCFRMIPNRILEDDDANLVRNIVLRTHTLLGLAERIFPIMKDKKKSASAKFEEISPMIQEAPGLGETWSKMLMVCIDMAYPKVGLLASQCDVGVGALTPLRRLLPGGGPADQQEALEELRKAFNGAGDASAKHFWELLHRVEARARDHFSALPLILEQTETKKGKLLASTLQVQLCEYRQFRHALARNKYGLPHDESMKEAEKERRLKPEDFLERDEKKKLVTFKFPPKEKDGKPLDFKTPVAAASGRWRVAERVALHCFQKLQAGATLAEAEALRDELNGQCGKTAQDAPDKSGAWEACRAQLAHQNPLVSFSYQAEGAKKIPFQTTVKAAGGVMEAERIARLCYEKFESGASKEQVLDFRGKLYAKVAAELEKQEQQQQPKRKAEQKENQGPALKKRKFRGTS